jgi:Domain of unknown function (DUF4340)
VSGTKTLVWAGVLLALAAFYYVYEIQGGKRRQEATRQQELLVHFAADDVTGLTLQRATDTITAVKRDGRWQLTAPLSAPGDARKYGELVQRLTEIRRLRLVEEQPATLEPFGLTSPGLEIQISLKEQSAPLVLRLGGKNPTGSGYYTQVEGRPAVYLIDTSTKDTLDASLHDLRDKTVLAFETADVQEVQIIPGAEAPVVLQRQEKDQWQMTAPTNTRADERQVQSLLRSLRDVKVQAFVAEQPAALEPYGLHTPMLRLALTVGTDRTVKTLLLGKLDTDQKGIYAKRNDADNVLLLPQQFWDNLPKTVTALRDKTLLHYDREHIVRLELHAPEGPIVITRTGPRQYKLEQPIVTDGDSDTIYSLLWDLKELKAKDFVADTPEASSTYGLEPPRRRITLWEKPSDNASETLHTMLFGDENPEQQGTYVKIAERPTIALVDSLEAQRLIGRTVFDLRNKKLLAFETEAIQKIQLQYPTSALTLERQGDSWRLSEPQKQAIQTRWKVDNLLYELSTLEYASVVAETVENGVPYGLDTPQFQVTLWRRDGTTLGPLSIGKTADPGSDGTRLVYAQANPHAPLYTVKAEFLGRLPKTPADLTADK